MPYTCCVKTCGFKNEKKAEDIFLITVPKEAKISEEWMRIIGKGRPLHQITSNICGLYFVF